MTREEAISELKYARSMCEFNPTTGEVRFRNEEDRRQAEAFDMAIEALKAQDIAEELTPDLADRLNDAYAKGYNAAKREIALSGEYERAYKRGVKDAEKKCEKCEFGNPCLYCKHQFEEENHE